MKLQNNLGIRILAAILALLSFVFSLVTIANILTDQLRATPRSTEQEQARTLLLMDQAQQEFIRRQQAAKDECFGKRGLGAVPVIDPTDGHLVDCLQRRGGKSTNQQRKEAK